MFGPRHLGGPKLGLHDASDYYVLTGDNGNSALDLSQLLGTSSSVGDIGTGSSSGMYLDIPLSQQLQVCPFMSRRGRASPVFTVSTQY